MTATDSTKVEFRGADGSTLAGRLELPNGEPTATAIFAHCFTCSKDVAAAARVSRALCRRGFAVLRFDFTGLGNSEGDFANTTFSSNVADLVAAAEHLRTTHRAPSLLIGHSLGGAAVLAGAGAIPEVRAVATIGAPSDPVHVQHLLVDAIDTIRDRGEAEVELAGRRFRIRREFLDDLDAQRFDRRVRELGRALLIFHSPQDEVVDVDHARRIYQAARHPKSFVTLDGADHLLTKRADSEYVADVLAAWAGRYVDTATPEPASTVSPAAPGELVVAETGAGKFQQTVRIGRHELLADEPPSVGGDDTGLAPYDFLLAALGTCVSMTLRMYANHKGWPLEHVAIRLSHEKIHAKDCESCIEGSTSGRIDRIDRTLELTGPLDDAQRARLLEIADRCPVHRTLEGVKEIRTALG